MPLIEALWARGIETVSSCEDTSEAYDWGKKGAGPPLGTAQVAFADKHDARRFARTARLGRAYDPSVTTVTPTAEDVAGAEEARASDGEAASDSASLGAVAVLFPAERIAAITGALGGDPAEVPTKRPARSVALLEATIKDQHRAERVVLDDDGDHLYFDGLDKDGQRVVFRYYVPPETWSQLDAAVRGESIGPLTLQPPKRALDFENDDTHGGDR